MSNKEFLFKKKVGIYSRPVNELSTRCDGPEPYIEAPRASISMVQNGYELRYNDVSFVSENLEKAMGMIKAWFEEQEEDAAKREKAGSESKG